MLPGTDERRILVDDEGGAVLGECHPGVLIAQHSARKTCAIAGHTLCLVPIAPRARMRWRRVVVCSRQLPKKTDTGTRSTPYPVVVARVNGVTAIDTELWVPVVLGDDCDLIEKDASEDLTDRAAVEDTKAVGVIRRRSHIPEICQVELAVGALKHARRDEVAGIPQRAHTDAVVVGKRGGGCRRRRCGRDGRDIDGHELHCGVFRRL